MFKPIEFSSMLERRILLRALGLGLAGAALTQKGLGQDRQSSETLFFAARSGRFNKQNTFVLIGGLIAPTKDAENLETALTALANRLTFKIPLRFSTNSHNPDYYRNSLELISSSHVMFVGVRVLLRAWPVDRAVWQFWRENAETKVFTAIAKQSPINFFSLRHDFDLDQEIYDDVCANLAPRSQFHLYPSTSRSTRLLQISGIIAKSLNNSERLLDSSANEYKNRMVQMTLNYFGISGVSTDITTEKITIKNIVL